MALSPYQPVEPGNGFRVLSLEPATITSDELRGSLLVVTLDDHPAYETLSYVWGKKGETRPVTVDGHEIRISQNLDEILRYLRLKDRPRNLWIDALCINQNDLQERNGHVGYMKEVYGRCVKNLVWLGANEALLSDGRAAMRHFGSIMRFGLDVKAGVGTEEFRTELHGMYPYGIRIDDRDHHCRAVKNLFYKPAIWSRVWIMQEIACAPVVQLLAGQLTMTWEEVEHFLDAEAYIKDFGMPSPFHGPVTHGFVLGGPRKVLERCVSFPQMLAHQRRLVQGTGVRHGYGSVFLDVLARFRHCRSTDPRDKVFGLFGLMSDTLGVTPSYDLPVEIVYADVAIRMMQSDNNLDLICQRVWPSSGLGQQERASWVPDFENWYQYPILFAQRGIFNASGCHDTFQTLWNHKTGLELHGCSFDSLAWIGNELSRSFRFVDLTQHFWQELAASWMPNALIREVMEIGNVWLENPPSTGPEMPRTSPYLSTGDALEAYWRTLLMDCKHFPLRRLNQADVQTIRESIFKPQLYTSDHDQDSPFDRSFLYQFGRTCRDWVFAVSSSGHFCMVPPESQPDDIIAVLHGGKVPVVLRPTGQRNEFRWVGPCYAHNHMDGEVWLRSNDLNMVEEDFRII